MSEWFGKSIDQPFYAFSTSHIIMLIIYFIGVVVLLLSYKRINMNPKLYQLLRWGFFSILLLSEVSYQYWAISNGVWRFGAYMPLHLCGIASFIAMFALWTNHKLLVQLAVFFGIIPAFLALLTPDIPYDYGHYRFWKFFIHHIVISISCIFLILTSKHTITFRSLITSFLLLVGYAVIIGVAINPIFGSNYMYLSGKPAANTPLDFLGDGFWYYINLGLIAIIVFFFLLTVFTLQEKRDSKGHEHK